AVSHSTFPASSSRSAVTWASCRPSRSAWPLAEATSRRRLLRSRASTRAPAAAPAAITESRVRATVADVSEPVPARGTAQAAARGSAGGTDEAGAADRGDALLGQPVGGGRRGDAVGVGALEHVEQRV